MNLEKVELMHISKQSRVAFSALKRENIRFVDVKCFLRLLLFFIKFSRIYKRNILFPLNTKNSFGLFDLQISSVD